jgi:hypothetical protein
MIYEYLCAMLKWVQVILYLLIIGYFLIEKNSWIKKVLTFFCIFLKKYGNKILINLKQIEFLRTASTSFVKLRKGEKEKCENEWKKRDRLLIYEKDV